MIKIQNTPKLAGVKISGSYDDLFALIDALYKITVDMESDKNKTYINISTRLLGVDLKNKIESEKAKKLVQMLIKKLFILIFEVYRYNSYARL